MGKRGILKRMYLMLMGQDEPLPERKTISPETVKRLQEQVDILSKRIRSLEFSVAEATLCGVEVPQKTCEALYAARRDRRARLVVLNRLAQCNVEAVSNA